MSIPSPVAVPVAVGPHVTLHRHRVVVGMDDDPASMDALRFAVTEAAYRDGFVVALHVWRYPSSWGYPVAWRETNLGAAMTTRLQLAVETVLAERVEAGEPVVDIMAEVVQGATVTELSNVARGAALLVLGARHHNRFLGSVGHGCSSHPPCPVVVVPATTAA